MSEEKEKTCECGVSFKDKVYHYGEKINENSKCLGCRKKVSDIKRREESEAEIAKYNESQKDYWQKNCGISAYYWYKTFDNFESKSQLRAFNAVKSFRWEYDKDDNPPQSLVLSSPSIYGVGKTHLIAALINNIIQTEEKAYLDQYLTVHTTRCPVFFTTENELLRRIRNTFNHNTEEQETEAKLYKRLASYPLLIIDDVGKVRPKDNTFTQGVYFDIIDQRYTTSKSIILTTNLDYAELEVHIGGASADRLREMCGKNFIKMTGKSFRQGGKNVDLPAKA